MARWLRPVPVAQVEQALKLPEPPAPALHIELPLMSRLETAPTLYMELAAVRSELELGLRPPGTRSTSLTCGAPLGSVCGSSSSGGGLCRPFACRCLAATNFSGTVLCSHTVLTAIEDFRLSCCQRRGTFLLLLQVGAFTTLPGQNLKPRFKSIILSPQP